MEKEDLVFYRVTPVVTVVSPGTGDEVVGDIAILQLFVQTLIHLIKKILRTTVKNNLQSTWSEQVQLPHYTILLPSFRLVTQCPQLFRHAPLFRKWADIHSTTNAATGSKNILIAKTQVQSTMPKVLNWLST